MQSARGKSAREAEELADDCYDDAGFGMDDDMSDADYELDAGLSRRQRRKARQRAKNKARQRYGRDWYGLGWRSRSRKHRTGHWYRDKAHKKICGVCAGTAQYFGRPVWEFRLYAVLGLIFIPSVTIPTYFIMYFLLDDTPYYRRVTDRFTEVMDRRRDDRDHGETRTEATSKMSNQESREPQMNNVQAMKVAKDKFSDIEQRLREMESHVTSSRFELQRELKKISGED